MGRLMCCGFLNECDLVLDAVLGFLVLIKCSGNDETVGGILIG